MGGGGGGECLHWHNSSAKQCTVSLHKEGSHNNSLIYARKAKHRGSKVQLWDNVLCRPIDIECELPVIEYTNYSRVLDCDMYKVHGMSLNESSYGMVSP